jgi:hypothetical protein
MVVVSVAGTPSSLRQSTAPLGAITALTPTVAAWRR